MEIIKANSIIKKFYVGTENELEILHGLNFNVNKGEFISIVGASGSGKSTIGKTIIGLEKATSGEILYNGKNILDPKIRKEMKFNKNIRLINT